MFIFPQKKDVPKIKEAMPLEELVHAISPRLMIRVYSYIIFRNLESHGTFCAAIGITCTHHFPKIIDEVLFLIKSVS